MASEITPLETTLLSELRSNYTLIPSILSIETVNDLRKTILEADPEAVDEEEVLEATEDEDGEEKEEKEIKTPPKKELETIQNWLKDDEWLVRWLRARSHTPLTSLSTLRKSLLWRLDHAIYELEEKEVDPVYPFKYPRDLVGHDKMGRPVILAQFGSWDVPFTVETDDHIKNFRDYTLKGVEQLMGAIRDADKKQENGRITQCVIVIDMEGFSWMSLLNVYAVQNGLSLLSEYEANYPETLHSCYVINASNAIGMLLNLVKGVLAERTYEKIKVFYSDPTTWIPALLEVIDSDQLPQKYGGCKEEVAVEIGEDCANKESDDDDEFEEAREEI